jgi:hypothetical protein
MLDVLNPFILWPIGVALGGLLFFEIAKHCWRVDPVPRAFEARSKAIGPEWPAANAPRPARAAWPSRPAEAQRILAGNEAVWSIPSGNVNPTRREARVMVSIRVIGEDAVAPSQRRSGVRARRHDARNKLRRQGNRRIARPLAHFGDPAKAGCWLRQAVRRDHRSSRNG